MRRNTERHLIDGQSQRLELLAVLLPRLGGVVGHKHQPLALQHPRERPSLAEANRLECFYAGRTSRGSGLTFARSKSSVSGTPPISLSPFQITPARHEFKIKNVRNSILRLEGGAAVFSVARVRHRRSRI
jgi:hypothetical protein